MLAERIGRIHLSPTLRINALAREMRARGVDVLDFSAGEPDFPTPERVKEAGQRAIAENRTRYTANEGLLEFREAIAEKLGRDNGLEYSPDQILVTVGAKASLYFAVMALFQEGQDVLIPSPYWVSYPEQVCLAGARPVIVPTREEAGFKLSPEELAAAMTPAARGLLLNYPANPTGACYDRAELLALARVCLARGVVIIADEIYEKLIYDNRTFTSIASLSPEILASTIVINGMSKAYSMTGWRIGYAAGPKTIIEAMGRVQSHCTSNAATMAQWASLEALRAAGENVRGMRREFERRRDEVVSRIQSLPRVSCVAPSGAFYAFPNVSALFGRDGVSSSEDLARYLLERARVAVVPGEGFGSARHVRISFAASLEQIREGMDRIAEALHALCED